MPSRSISFTMPYAEKPLKVLQEGGKCNSITDDDDDDADNNALGRKCHFSKAAASEAKRNMLKAKSTNRKTFTVKNPHKFAPN
ncbi:unnamed protein product [Ceratitis capitata]|uniref:(Mediterranean fruit fly) hypothetical protein n=1 Tax=Ceratitis capitata TaxID=7213 RepID=A0A811VJP9_CERCA|nr:unnamed protein product [Ceratitis capitata]